MKSKYSAVIVAGGSGTRMQAKIPKQFMKLCGLPVLMHTIKAFSGYDERMPVVVVLSAVQMEYWKELCRQYDFLVPHTVVEGGSSRFESVKNGLSRITDSGWVAIHDGVRPLIDRATIHICFQEAERYGCAIPVIQLTDSVREIKGVELRKSGRKPAFSYQNHTFFVIKSLLRQRVHILTVKVVPSTSVFTFTRLGFQVRRVWFLA